MLQGTSSSVGKSYLAAGLCRLYARRGLKVAPFKAQNMALNAAVTLDGYEIGRAQAVQAQGAGVASEVAMNPILLKAEGESTCQVIFMGRSIGRHSATEYRQLRPSLWPEVKSALNSLRRRFDLVIIEGAGSPAELNLRHGELVNMRVAAAADAPVLLVADIERGGVFASLLGTLDLLRPAERARVKGLVVNRFRGDPGLFRDGVQLLERRSGLPVLGVVPSLDIRLPAEDSLDLPRLNAPRAGAALDVVVIGLPRISNFDDFEPLLDEPGVSLRLITEPGRLGRPDLIILPGSKATMADLAHLRRTGMGEAIRQARVSGAAVVGVCGGYQMLGRTISDPLEVEQAGEMPGLDLLPASTTFEPEKVTQRRVGVALPGPGMMAGVAGVLVTGYEIRMGRVLTQGQPALELAGEPEGCLSEDGWVLGTSLHGLFLNADLRRAILRSLAARKGACLPEVEAGDGDPFDLLADALAASLNLAALDAIVWKAAPAVRR
ncbi:MAG: cobyric acid synthase [Candidatus Dormibacteria bacterium]